MTPDLARERARHLVLFKLHCDLWQFAKRHAPLDPERYVGMPDLFERDFESIKRNRRTARVLLNYVGEHSEQILPRIQALIPTVWGGRLHFDPEGRPPLTYRAESNWPYEHKRVLNLVLSKAIKEFWADRGEDYSALAIKHFGKKIYQRWFE